MTTQEYLNKLKILLGPTGTEGVTGATGQTGSSGATNRDELLTIIIEDACARLLLRLEGQAKTVPDELSYIVVEVAVARFNRLANEGMTSVAVEGETLNFSEDPLDQYAGDIRSWLDAQEGTKTGKVRIF